MEEKAIKALGLVEDAELMHVFDEVVWISVDRELWEEFTGSPIVEEEDPRDHVAQPTVVHKL